MKRIWIRVSEDLDLQLRQEAGRRNVPAPDFTRFCLETGLQKIQVSEMLRELKEEMQSRVLQVSEPSAAAIDDQLAFSILYIKNLLSALAADRQTDPRPLADTKTRQEFAVRKNGA